MSRIVVIGSGETAPTMARVHRDLLADRPAGAAALLDTPFAFQLNRDDIVARTLGYFTESVGQPVELVHWPPVQEDPTARDRALAVLDLATWACAGPGSPTYALEQWRGTAVPAALAGVVRRGGTLVLGSAAALTLGSHTVPVYEIYKVGAPAFWAEGLDLLGELTGIRAAVVPHYDNTEGRGHDTRFCYLGETRLAAMETELPDEVGVLGVDEHTAVVLDLAAGKAQVHGNGGLSIRRRGTTRVVGAGSAIALDDLAALLQGVGSRGATGGPAAPTAPAPVARRVDGDIARVALSVREEADRARAAFDGALADRDVRGCVSAVLDLERAVAEWGADTLQSDDLAEARRVLRTLVVRLGEVAEAGVRDPKESISPYVDLLLELRDQARSSGNYGTADFLRDRLVALGVEVRDTPTGSSWTA